jgi:hypothetical protein
MLNEIQSKKQRSNHLGPDGQRSFKALFALPGSALKREDAYGSTHTNVMSSALSISNFRA